MMMDDDNDSPYVAPRAGLAGRNHIIYEEMKPLSLTQRLNRLRYACYQLTASVILTLILVLLLMLVSMGEDMGSKPLKIGAVVLMVVAAIAFAVYMVGLAVRRLHDLGHSGWMVLLWVALGFAPMPLVLWGTSDLMMLLATLLQPFFTLYLYAGAGTDGMNVYGTPNPPNGILVNLFGGAFSGLMVLSILLGILINAIVFLNPELAISWGLDGVEQDWYRLRDQILNGLPGR